MEWTQFAIFFLSVFGLFLWNRAESRADNRHMDVKLDANRELIREVHKESSEKIEIIREETKVFREETRSLIMAIQLEMKDFHSKFLEIQKKNI
jgi:hypothetical protein